MNKCCCLVVFLFIAAQAAYARGFGDVDTVKRKPVNGFYSDSYFLIGGGQYTSISDRLPAADIGAKAGYRFGHFYVNLGVGVLGMRDNVVSYNVLLDPTSSVLAKYVLEIPVGIGVVTTHNRMTAQVGIDMPYLTEIELPKAECGYAFSPNASIMWKRKKKERYTGIMVKALINMQRSATILYDPSFFGIGVIFR